MLMQSRSHRIEQFLNTDVSRLTGELRAIENLVASRKQPAYDSEYNRLLQAINNACQACADIEQVIGDDRDLLNETRHLFRKRIAPWFDKSRWMTHAKTKPQGYPGDYKMLIAIYEKKTPSQGIGGYLDLYFLNTELGKAVPARMKSVLQFLEQQLEQRSGDMTILDVACGPCEEFAQHRIPLDLDRDVQVSFLDFDRDALAYVEGNVIASRADRAHFHCIRYNALRMRSSNRFIKQYGKFDLIYSVGLCDYIENRLLIPMLRGWRETTNENGVVFIAFKDKAYYDKNVYQWLVDWHFLQRSLEDCLQILDEAGFDIDQVEMTRDETGIIMNFMAPVTSPRQRRTDQAHSRVAATAHRNGQPASQGPSADEPIFTSEVV